MQTTGHYQREGRPNTHASDRHGHSFHNESRFPPYIFGKSKRIRNKNWELLEIQVLKKMIGNHYDLLNSRHTNAMMNARKNLVWKRIAESINALGLHKRTIRELKIKWSNMRLTERRKSGYNNGEHNASSSRNGSDNSVDIVDISESSFESAIELDRDVTSNHKEPLLDTTNTKSNNQQPQPSFESQESMLDINDEIRWFNSHKQTNDEQLHHIVPQTRNQNEYSSIQRQPDHDEFQSPSKHPNRTNQTEWSATQIKHNIESETFHRTAQPEWRDLNMQQNCHPSSVVDSSANRLSSNDDSPFGQGINNVDNTTLKHGEKVPDFSQDRIYMPNVVVKPEPSEFQQDKDLSDVHISINRGYDLDHIGTQTDWKLSCRHEYDCPSIPVSDRDIKAIKYEILKLEREQLILKNQNMELQNEKLRKEISKL